MVFKKWKKARLLKRIQEDCFHEYYVVGKYLADTGKYPFTYDYQDFFDMYCPKCDKTIYEISKIDKERQLEIQKVRNNYKESH